MNRKNKEPDTIFVGTPDGKEVQCKFYLPPVTTVEFVDGTASPMYTLIATTRGYSGVYSTAAATVEEHQKFLKDIQSTPLGTPLEMIHMTFLIKDIPRSTTHQLVRTRIGAAYVQESTRFLGHKSVYKFLITKGINSDPKTKTAYMNMCKACVLNYENALLEGVPNQDARLILPHSILTNMFVNYSLKTLLYIYRQRMCCQAELTVWVPLMLQIKKVIADKYSESIANMLKAPIDVGVPCGYNASFDRPCTWKERIPVEELI